MEAGYIVIKTKIDNKDFSAQITQTEKKLEELKFQEEAILKSSPYPEQEKQLIDLRAEISKTTNQLADLYKKQSKLTQSNGGWKHVTEQIENSSESLKEFIEKVGKAALAVFSLRSAYSFVRQAASTLASENEKISNDITNIRSALANTMTATIENIIGLVKKLMAYINYIWVAWYGKPLFQSSADSAKNMSDNVKNANKNAQKLKKTLLGFDELNILNDNVKESSDSGISNGNYNTSAFNKEIESLNTKPPVIIEWIAKNKNKVLGFFKGLAQVLATIKITKWVFNLGKLITGTKTISGLLSGMSNLALFGILAGLAGILIGIGIAIEGVIKFIKDPSWKNFTKVIEGLSIALTGVGIALVAMKASNPIGWIALAVGAIGTLVSAFAGSDKTVEDSTKKINEYNKKLEEARQEIEDLKVSAGKSIDDALAKISGAEEIVNSLDGLVDANGRVVGSTKEVNAKLELLNGLLGTEYGLSEGYITINGKKIESQKEFNNSVSKTIEKLKAQATQEAINQVYVETIKMRWQRQKELNEKLEEATQSMKDFGVAEGKSAKEWAENNKELINQIAGLSKDVQDYGIDAQNMEEAMSKALSGNIEEANILMSKTADSARDDINDVIEKIVEKSPEISDAIKKQADIISNVNATLGIEVNVDKNSLNKVVNEITNTIGKKTYKFTTKSDGTIKIGAMATGGILIPKNTYLASGGIVDVPKTGVNIGGAIAGEAGAEGVLPLTNPQTMAELGREIGQWITLNINMTNELDGRVLNNRLEQIKNNNSFARNGVL